MSCRTAIVDGHAVIVCGPGQRKDRPIVEQYKEWQRQKREYDRDRFLQSRYRRDRGEPPQPELPSFEDWLKRADTE